MRFNMRKGTLCALAVGMLLAGAVPAYAAGTQAVESVAGEYSLTFDASRGIEESMDLLGKTVAYRAYRDIVYVAHPKSATWESMNIFIPEAYFRQETVNGYTAKTAPIFMPNNVGGYMPGRAGEPSAADPMSGGANAILVALSRGYVVASPAIRGRTTTDETGAYVGKAPALIADYKAAVRYLRHNRETLPAGDTEKIISSGTSAGGALSALLGATGNCREYAPYLEEIGAARERDDIFASMAYCPITNLEHADMAYEWVFSGVNEYHQGGGMRPPAGLGEGREPLSGAPVRKQEGAGRPMNAPQETSAADGHGWPSAGEGAGRAAFEPASEMSAEEIAASDDLKKMFPAYVNWLELKDEKGKYLTLDMDGNGPFKDYIASVYLASAQQALDSGEDLSAIPWLTVKGGKAISMDFEKYAHHVTRLKAAPAFDKLDLSSGENDELGTIQNVPRHFTSYARDHSAVKGGMADDETIRLMNPMNFIGTSGARVAEHWRIRHGSEDRDTSMAIPAMLALRLENDRRSVDFAAAWGKGHAGDYDLPELFDWIDRICKAKHGGFAWSPF